MNLINKFCEKALYGNCDSDRHLISIFSIALSSRGKTFIELGVREGYTTEPLLLSAEMNNGHLWSVDINPPSKFVTNSPNYTFCKQDSIEFLKNWDVNKKVDVIYVDDWHSYPHVKEQLELIDRIVSPSSIVLLHDLMYGNTDPFYHCDLTLNDGQWAKGGPYRAVAELNPQFWEWSTLPWNNGLTILRKKYSNKYHRR
jgi:predicted O-methyltransferase YrrM